jgi:hypothetical protein
VSAVLKAVPPVPQKCHACENVFAGAVCPICKAERPAYTAMKRITALAHHGVQPLRDPKFCRYFPAQICGCGGTGNCLEAA